MKIIKVVYNKKSSFIIDIINKFEDTAIISYFDTDFIKDKKKARPLQTDYGTTQVPLVIFEDENQKGYAAIYSENDPDWEKEIIKYLKYI